MFAAWESVAPDVYTREYVRALVNGKDWNEVRAALNEVAKPIHPSNANRELYEKLSY